MTVQVIRHVSFAYREQVDDPVRPGKTIWVEKKAWQGETVDIPLDEDVQRGLRHGAFVTPDQPAVRQPELPQALPRTEEDQQVEESSVADMSDEELVEWIQRDKPNVRTVVDAAEGDREQAKRLLEAEDRATGGDPRKGVLDSLSAIVANAT